jgi:hypothetical protein
MRKVKKIGSSGIKNLVKKHFSDNNVFLPEHKIDDIIKEYLFERSTNDVSDFEEKTSFSPKSVEAIQEIIISLLEIKDDLEIIMEKESDVLVYNDQYADEVLSYHVRDLGDLIDDLEDMIDVTKNNNSDNID